MSHAPIGANDINALLLVGSMHSNSHTQALVNAVARELETNGVEAKVWDLFDNPVPMATLDAYRDYSTITDVNMLQLLDDLRAADIIVLGTPIYHGSYSSRLKNVLDYLSKDELRDKPVGLVCNGSGTAKSMLALSHLTAVVQSLYGVPMQTQIGSDGSHYEADGHGYSLKDEAILMRCQRLAADLIRFHKAFEQNR